MSKRLPLYLTMLVSGVIWLTFGPLLDSITGDLGIPLAQGGLPATTFFFGGILGVICLNVFLARVPVKRCLVGAAVLEAAALAATGLFTRGLWSFAGAYFFVGFACMILAGIPGMWVSVHVRDKAAWALNLLVLCSVVAMTLTPLVLGLLLGAGASWRWVYVAEAVLTLALSATVAALPLADIPGRENLRLRQLKAVVSHNPRLLAAIGAAAFLYMGTEMTLNTWLPKFEVDVFGASATWASLAVTFYLVGQIIGRAATIQATRRFLPSTLLRVSMAVMAAFLGALALSPTRVLSIAFSFGAGLAASSSISHVSSYSSKFPHWHAGVVFSICSMVAGAGGMVFPYITGPAAAAWGFRPAFAVAAVLALIVAALGFALRRASGEGRQDEELSGI
jgi:MFS transporter, FHS family, glucose/mannose:H+ symporter